MLRFVYFLVGNILAVLALSQLLPTFTVDSLLSAALFVIFLTGINSLILPLIKLFTFPINLLTLGLFNWVLNILVILVVSNSVSGVSITGGFWTQSITIFVISVTISIVSSIARILAE